MGNFKPGDVVRLKSGGPKMTVQDVSHNVYCVWFAGTEQKGASFASEALERFEEKPVPHVHASDEPGVWS